MPITTKGAKVLGPTSTTADPPGNDAATGALQSDVVTAVRTWRDGLINLTGTNRALNFRHTKTGSVAIYAPEPIAILEGLRNEVQWSLEGELEATDISDPDSATDTDRASAPRALPSGSWLSCRKPERDLGAVLRSLARKANQEFLDRGLSVMYLGFGMLHWQDLDGKAYASPLLLVPVELVPMGQKNKPQLRINRDEDPTVNPALTLRLAEFGVTLPMIDDAFDMRLMSLLAQVRSIIQAKRGWSVTEDVVLSAFSFQKEAMYRDLLTNEAAITGHPLVAALANQDPTTQDSSLLFDEIQPENIDRDAPPEATPLVLDADSSQRACIAAAIAGHSFVMDGPPGTGKSQTIANVIGSLLHAGKTVLFVSEKAAALEVVRNRLAQVGLNEYVLELHSHKASRKQVAAQLATALDSVPVPPLAMDAADRRRAAERRTGLNAYAAAMNRIRLPLGQPLHHVLGLIATLDHVPAAPTPAAPGENLSQVTLQEIADASGALERAWRPAVQGRSFLWRQVIDRSPLDSRLYAARSALEELVGTAAHNSTLVNAFELGTLSDLQILVDLLGLVGSRPAGVQDAWLTRVDFGSVGETAEFLGNQLSAIESAEARVVATAGVSWNLLPDPADLPGRTSLAYLRPSAMALDDVTAADARKLAARFEADAAMLSARLAAATGLAGALRMPPVATVNDIDVLLGLADTAFVPHRPERAWLTPGGLSLAQHAATILRQRVFDLDTTETSARRLYTDAALSQPLTDLHERFTTVHRGLRKLFGAYRRDKKLVAEFTAEMVSLEQAINDLGLAVAWSTATSAYAADEASLSAVLGNYWRGRSTDFDALNQALAVARDVLQHCPESLLPAVVDHITAPPEPAIKALIDQTRADLTDWRASLASPTTPTAPPELLLVPIADAIAWLNAHQTPLRDAAVVAHAVSNATERTLSYGDSLALLDARQSVVAAREALYERAETFEAELGETLFQGLGTDIAALNRALAWAHEARLARQEVDLPMTVEQVKGLESARITERLEPALQKWQAAAAAVVAAFEPARRLELSNELDNQALAASLLAELQADSSGQEEWITYAQARADLAGHGLADVVRFCIDQRVPADQVSQVVRRAVFRSWADAILATDGDLSPHRATDRSDLIEQFRQLDRQLILAATGDIIRAVNARRPRTTDFGEPALIRREGLKKKRHMSVRDLIQKTRTTTQAIKPCFMMSPLAVSQYLPTDMHFDVVIFDEASQVTPGDAINCVYRASALIAAGDDRQLPPTSFFDRMNDDEEEPETDVKDFQSILELSKASGAFRNLGLKWHYRSRHEALIAFSNQRFYEGKLVTFPGSHSEGPDVGIELIPVDGVYRRGTARDNPIEAEQVARRVVHHFDTRPDTSLGVVTFSVAQADAIQAALDRKLDERPDLSSHLDGDRLHGFFIKSLESVQGDERDVMIFSIGYGPDEHGKITANFGALNKEKGWRRLNVAITRARQRVEIITSIRAGDIPDSTNESVRHLAGYLDYAERGLSALALDLSPSGLGTDSPFEDSVIDTIRAMGLTAEPQVGAAGYRIDIGVRHPAHPSVYAIGVECDGYMYHSSPSARDRDRLRQQVLEGLGWRLHRIWGTSWYRDRLTETDRLREAIEAAINAPVTGRLSGLVDPFERAEIELADVDRSAPPPWVTPYVVAAVPALPRWTDPSDNGAHFDMVKGIEILARDEGPIHIDLVHQRLRDAWGIGRVGSIVRANILTAIRHADVVFEEDFLDLPTRDQTRVRVPTDGQGQRTAAQVSEIELRNALTYLLKDAGTVTPTELFTATARVFGWSRRGPDITNRLDWILLLAVDSGEVIVQGDSVKLRNGR